MEARSSKHILLGVTGSVAAIKVPELVATLLEQSSVNIMFCNIANYDDIAFKTGGSKSC